MYKIYSLNELKNEFSDVKEMDEVFMEEQFYQLEMMK